MSDLFTQYLEAMRRLPIDNPTTADFQSVCPHLTARQVKNAFTPQKGEREACVATPPARVRNGILVVRYFIGNDGPRLHFFFSRRITQSRADDTAQGAMAYADKYWPEQLVPDTWVDYSEFLVDDPANLAEDGGPTSKFVVGYALRRSKNTLYNDWSKPRSELFDDAIIQMSIDSFVSSELRGGRGGYCNYNCANCGAGLGLHGCPNCGLSFRDNGVRSGWNTPLPPKVVRLLKDAGHEFGVDPAIAWGAEREMWERATANSR